MMKKLSRNIFILETALFAINFYFGIYSLFDMIPDKINIKLYHLLFRDDEKNTWKYPNYMEWACEYQMNPRYSILLTIVIFVFSILVVKHSRNEKGKKKMAIILISLLILLLSLVITFGVIYCYRDEMAHESV